MNPWMAYPFKRLGKFRLGDRVGFLYGRKGQTGEIVEDRGNIGRNGRRLYRVKVREDEWNTIEVEYPEEALELIERSEKSNST